MDAQDGPVIESRRRARRGGTTRMIGLAVGPSLFGLAIVGLGGNPDLDVAGRVVLGLVAWMAVWWITEAVPLAATALLPPVVLPLAPAGPDIKVVATGYGDPYVLLFAGGFLLALAMQRWQLHRRIALMVLSSVGGSARSITAGFMGLGAFLSMWVSNTATAVTMLPIALSVLAVATNGVTHVPGVPRLDPDRFARALLLSIAFGCSMGGCATLVGSPPNALLASFLAGEDGSPGGVSFLQWMLVGGPVALLLLPIGWALLVLVIERVPAVPIAGGREAMRRERRAMGPMSRAERLVLVVFVTTAGAWLLRGPLTRLEIPGFGQPLAGLSDPAIAIAAGIAMFVLPSGDPERPRLLDWETARGVPWEVLILFGGGLAIARAVTATGVDVWLGGGAEMLGGVPPIVVTLIVVAVVVFATELCSNTALVAAALPVLGAAAEPLGIPAPVLLVPATIAASCAFMMPVATPPNAVVFGSGRLTIGDMVRAGFLMNIAAAIVVTAVCALLVPRVF